MKNIKICIVAALTLVGFSCSDRLEIADPNNTGDAIALSTDQNVKTTLIGAYNELSNGAFFGGNTLRNSELLADNSEVNFSGTFNDVSDLYRKEMISANSDATNAWIQGYATINVANNILSALDVVNDADKDQVEGEALFLRGISLFELVQFFALPYSAGNASTNPGVPIMLVDDRNSTAPVPRATVQEVYEQIISDLSSAEAKLLTGPNNGKATSEAAAAILSRVYLQMANYASARDAANRVITSGNYGLVLSDISNCFNGGSTTEDIFDIAVSTVDGVNNMNTFYASSSNGGRGDIEVQQTHLDLYEADDDRLNLFYTDPATGDTRVGKWINRFGNVKVVRLAEMYLTRAESNFRLSTSIGATPLADVNTIRDRVNLTALGSITSVDQILNERMLELAHEGQKLHDFKRLQKDVIQGVTVFPYNDPALVFPIPKRERDINPDLVQNPGY